MTDTCPARKLEPEGRVREHGIVRLPDDEAGERWAVRSFAAARQVLREPEATRQAGFGAGTVADAKIRPPILYQEGAQHRRQRSAAARFFAPKVTEGYRDMMERLSAELVAEIHPDRPTDLTHLAMRLAVQVAGQVVGLTGATASGRREPAAGMSRRLDTFFQGDPGQVERTPAGLVRALRRATATARFYWLDVKPAIRARRRDPQADVISQLIDQGFSDPEILTECLTYAAAGMVTTREFITMAAWHLLDHPPLLARYRAGDTADRVAALQETLRLEPVVGHLLRRTESPLTVTTEEGPVTVGAGALLDVDVRATNADPATAGPAPYALCPGRDLPPSVPPALLSFGDGHHRCPGAAIAIMESEIFLSELLAGEVTADGPPRVRWNAVTQGYELDRFLVRRRAPLP